MQALQLCNGRIDLSLPIVPQEIRDLLPLIEERGLIARCEPGDSIAPEQEYRCYPAHISARPTGPSPATATTAANTATCPRRMRSTAS